MKYSMSLLFVFLFFLPCCAEKLVSADWLGEPVGDEPGQPSLSCGNGELDPNEECDDGVANSDVRRNADGDRRPLEQQPARRT